MVLSFFIEILNSFWKKNIKFTSFKPPQFYCILTSIHMVGVPGVAEPPLPSFLICLLLHQFFLTNRSLPVFLSLSLFISVSLASISSITAAQIWEMTYLRQFHPYLLDRGEKLDFVEVTKLHFEVKERSWTRLYPTALAGQVVRRKTPGGHQGTEKFLLIFSPEYVIA